MNVALLCVKPLYPRLLTFYVLVQVHAVTTTLDLRGTAHRHVQDSQCMLLSRKVKLELFSMENAAHGKQRKTHTQ